MMSGQLNAPAAWPVTATCRYSGR